MIKLKSGQVERRLSLAGSPWPGGMTLEPEAEPVHLQPGGLRQAVSAFFRSMS